MHVGICSGWRLDRLFIGFEMERRRTVFHGVIGHVRAGRRVRSRRSGDFRTRCGKWRDDGLGRGENHVRERGLGVVVVTERAEAVLELAAQAVVDVEKHGGALRQREGLLVAHTYGPPRGARLHAIKLFSTSISCREGGPLYSIGVSTPHRCRSTAKASRSREVSVTGTMHYA